MSRIRNEIARLYPLLAGEQSATQPDEQSDSRLMADLASHVVDSYEAGQVESVRAAFELTELLIAAGSEDERHSAIVGFLETVQNVASHRYFGASAFESFLEPLSQRAWTELTDLWKGKATLAEVVASETGASLNRRWWQFWKKSDGRTPREMLSQVQNPELRRIIEQITRE